MDCILVAEVCPSIRRILDARVWWRARRIGRGWSWMGVGRVQMIRLAAGRLWIRAGIGGGWTIARSGRITRRPLWLLLLLSSGSSSDRALGGKDGKSVVLSHWTLSWGWLVEQRSAGCCRPSVSASVAYGHDQVLSHLAVKALVFATLLFLYAPGSCVFACPL